MKLTHIALAINFMLVGAAVQASNTEAMAMSTLTATPNTDAIRKPSTVVQFRKLYACPATGKVQSTCPGWVIDHIVPLCAGGTDSVDNMEWQTAKDSYKKDAFERSVCKQLASCAKAAK